jgi:hypothetical protein
MATKKATKSSTEAKTVNSIITKRFVIRKSLIGTGTLVSFTNSKGTKYTYDHDEVYNSNKQRFDEMPCFEKYGNYTNSNAVPAFARSLDSVTITGASE